MMRRGVALCVAVNDVHGGSGGFGYQEKECRLILIGGIAKVRQLHDIAWNKSVFCGGGHGGCSYSM